MTLGSSVNGVMARITMRLKAFCYQTLPHLIARLPLVWLLPIQLIQGSTILWGYTSPILIPFHIIVLGLPPSLPISTRKHSTQARSIQVSILAAMVIGLGMDKRSYRHR